MSAVWASVFVFVFLLWRGRERMAAGWELRHALPAGLYWGIAGLFALMGAAFSFAVFGATHLRIAVSTAALQFVAMASFVAIAMLFWGARRLAKPWLDAAGILHADRNQMHSLWAAFWGLGMGLGFLPLLFPAPT